METSGSFLTATGLSFAPEIYVVFETSGCKKIASSLRYGLAAIFLQPLVLNSNSTEKLYLKLRQTNNMFSLHGFSFTFMLYSHSLFINVTLPLGMRSHAYCCLADSNAVDVDWSVDDTDVSLADVPAGWPGISRTDGFNTCFC